MRVHGAFIIKVGDRITMSCQTSKPFTRFCGHTLSNVFVGEDYNPIKYTNPIILFESSEDFRKCYTTGGDYERYMQNPRYGTVEEHDLYYLSLRTVLKTVCSDRPVVRVRLRDYEIDATEHKLFRIGDKDVYTPSEVVIDEVGSGSITAEKLINEIDSIPKDDVLVKQSIYDTYKKDFGMRVEELSRNFE